MAGPDDPPALALENIGRRFGDTAALSGVSLALDAGEVVCLVGRSGCGKSSLLRLIAGVDQPDEGRILLNGAEVAGPGRFVEPEERNVGFMFQDYALFPHLTVEANIGFGLKALPRADARARVAEVIERVGIGALAGRFPHTLSGGEQQRVALARALAPRPVVLLMDEPFSNLDRGLREALRVETLAHLRALGTTAIMVTHDPEEALSAGDRVALMRKGRIVQAGTGYDIYDRPVSLYAAEFLSPGSRVEGLCRQGRIETPLGTYPAPAGSREGDRVVLFIRPQALSFAPQGEGVEARIVNRAFMGEREQFTLAVNGVAETLKLYASDRPHGAIGDWVHIIVNPGATLIFPHADTKCDS
ncbi:ABC transporter ATP-binding protein [Allorhizobium borbori]|uniref:Iron(III) transport system ATP-binding protein n=1 Tax=Allorhizobium borbori TaxID=485907 RepID=A0A7W6P323_9HYPH|nr:ABC transporter ATP-binding protein [Allorhizobium borbori]MBB4105248.1 iron(III) transport system ATP-binding protein [Allorhizobium borbori]